MRSLTIKQRAQRATNRINKLVAVKYPLLADGRRKGKKVKVTIDAKKDKMSTKTQVTEQEQRELHRKLIAQLSGLFATNIGDMTKLTAMNVAIDFCVAALVYVYKSTNTIADLKGEVVGDEVARRIDELVNTDSKP